MVALTPAFLMANNTAVLGALCVAAPATGAPTSLDVALSVTQLRVPRCPRAHHLSFCSPLGFFLRLASSAARRSSYLLRSRGRLGAPGWMWSSQPVVLEVSEVLPRASRSRRFLSIQGPLFQVEPTHKAGGRCAAVAYTSTTALLTTSWSGMVRWFGYAALIGCGGAFARGCVNVASNGCNTTHPAAVLADKVRGKDKEFDKARVFGTAAPHSDPRFFNFFSFPRTTRE